MALVWHSGRCHCGAVKFRCQAPADLVVYNCNCSICNMKRNTHFVVPRAQFELLGDSAKFISTYTFGTHTAKHTFCKVCGICSFYTPRSNPDGFAITVNCVDRSTVHSVKVEDFDGQNWEKQILTSSITNKTVGAAKL